MFTAGICDVMLRNNIRFDGGIGVSAGATFGINYKSRQIGRVIRYNKRFCNDHRYRSWRNLILTGNLFHADFCYHQIPFKYDIFDMKTYLENPMHFYVVVSDCITGKPIYKELKTCDHDEMEWLRASASMPVASRIVEVDGHKLLDGGITDSIPLRKFQEMGYNRNIVILTQPRDFVKKLTGFIGIIRHQLKDYPQIVHGMEQRHVMYNQEKEYIFQQEKLGNTMVLLPDSPLKIKIMEHDPAIYQKIYEEGIKLGEKKLQEIKAFLGQ